MPRSSWPAVRTYEEEGKTLRWMNIHAIMLAASAGCVIPSIWCVEWEPKEPRRQVSSQQKTDTANYLMRLCAS